MALPIRAALRSAGRFIAKNPTTMFSIARHALGLRIAVPLDALRWFIANTPPGKNAPTDVTVMSKPPSIQVGATLDLMGTRVRAGVAIRIEHLEIGSETLKVRLRLANLDMKVLGESMSPVAGLLRSGALDLSKPGNLANLMPKPPILIEAHDDVVGLDLMKNPKIRDNERVRSVLSTLTPVVNVTSIETDKDFLVVKLRATPLGFPRALNAARALTTG